MELELRLKDKKRALRETDTGKKIFKVKESYKARHRDVKGDMFQLTRAESDGRWCRAS